jgi:hypothetical protein
MWLSELEPGNYDPRAAWRVEKDSVLHPLIHSIGPSILTASYGSWVSSRKVGIIV